MTTTIFSQMQKLHLCIGKDLFFGPAFGSFWKDKLAGLLCTVSALPKQNHLRRCVARIQAHTRAGPLMVTKTYQLIDKSFHPSPKLAQAGQRIK